MKVLMPQKTRSPARWERMRARLLEIDDVVEIQGHRGEVLVYAGHQPPGLFLVTAARIEVAPPGEKTPRPFADTSRGPFLLPALPDLDRPAPATITLGSDAELIFIPRSLAAGQPRLRKLLGSPDVPVRGWDQLA
ncbi:MAG: hypothetical protein D6718_06400 [Acidobacteria bacterium]|nr:MAG: hypothetical protein D6718_06400 [Acidobacteriota bacterium]